MRILVAYGTGTGQTRKIADFLAEHWRDQGHGVEVYDTSRPTHGLQPASFDRIVVASSMRVGSYRPSVVKFVRRFADALERVPNAFVSVTLSAANADKDETEVELNKRDARFIEKTGWVPDTIYHAAGGLPYTRYGMVTRWIMKRIAESVSDATDASRDYEFTDWAALGAFADHFMATPSNVVHLAA